MSKFSAEAQLNSKVSELLNNLEIDINKGKELYSISNLKWAMSKLDPDYDYQHTIKEINDFESKNNIEIDSKEYRTEVFNYLFHREVKSFVITNAKELKEKLSDILETENIENVIIFIEDEILKYNKLKEGVYGREYNDLSYSNNRFDHRFDVIWFYNERNRHKKNVPEDFIINFSDYPFLGIDIQHWIDFEKAYRFIPILKKILQFLRTSKNEFIKFDPSFNLENVLKKVNRFPHLFKDAFHCELFFHTVQFLPINNVVDWTYLFEILDTDQAFRKNIKQNHYIELVNKSYDKDLKQLRSDKSDAKLNKLFNLYRENKNTFEYLVKVYKH